jgi:murein DD-endopeptidase MepM/ murein hydrolase activator NlpD
VAIAVAATGAIGLGPGGVTLVSQNLQDYSAQANVLNGTSAVASNADRTAALSRSSSRSALEGASEQELLAAAEELSAQREEELATLAKDAEKFAAFVAKNAWQLPITPGVYNLTARYGEYGLWSSMHTGLDFAAPYGTRITAVASGIVTFADYDGAYGNRVAVTLENGTEIWYCHMSEIVAEVGETIISGQQVGNVGTTGHTTGAHLHLEVRPGAGDPVDPYDALIYHGVQP